MSADGTTVTTDASGHYTLPLAVGSHDVTATAFGHSDRTAHVAEGVLGPFLLGPGSYTLRLTTTDAYGRTRTLIWIVALAK